MKQPSIITGLLTLLLSVGLTSCDNNDDTMPKEVVQTTENPNFYLLIKDEEGNNLMTNVGEEQRFLPVQAYNGSNNEAVPFHQECINGTDYLVVTPAAPFHDAWDDEFVYTLNPTTVVSVGDAAFSLQRLFDYDLQRYQTSEGQRAVKVDYYAVRTTINDMLMQSDTATIVVSNGDAFLYREDYNLKVEIRFPNLTDEQLATDSLFRFRFFHEGLSIARPQAQWSFGRRDESTGEEQRFFPQSPADSTYTALWVEFPIPFYYNSYDKTQWFSFHYLMTSPLLFGDEAEHSFSMQLNHVVFSQTKDALTLYGMMVDRTYLSEVETYAYGDRTTNIVHQEKNGNDILLYFNWHDIYPSTTYR